MSSSRSGQRQYFAGSLQGKALAGVNCQKLKSVLEPMLISHDGPQLKRLRKQREGELQRRYLAYLQVSGECCPDAFLAKHIAAAPEGGVYAIAKDVDKDAHIQLMPREPPP